MIDRDFEELGEALLQKDFLQEKRNNVLWKTHDLFFEKYGYEMPARNYSEEESEKVQACFREACQLYDYTPVNRWKKPDH
jgi:hypothetical protein